MKPFYTKKLETIQERIQAIEYELETLKDQETKLIPLATTEREQLVAERTEQAENVLVQHESGAWFTSKQLLAIKNGELVVEVKNPKKVKDDKPKEPKPNPEVEPTPTIEPETESTDEQA